MSIFDHTLGNVAQILLWNLLIASTLLWTVVGCLTLVWTHSSAAIRHRLWGLSLLAVLVAPGIMSALPIPRWSLPARQSAGQSAVEEEAERDGVASGTDRTPQANLTSMVKHSESSTPPAHAVTQRSDIHSKDLADGKVGDPTVTTTPTSVELVIEFIRNTPWTTMAGIAVCCWILGAVISTIRFAGSLIWSGVWKCRVVILRNGREVNRCEDLRRRLGISRPVKLGTSSEISVPFILGWFRPVIVLPPGVAHWSESRLRIVLSHELMHARRGDLLWKLIGRVCLIFAWFHPLAWLAYWRLNIECEHACDDAVLQHGASACDYADHLVSVAAEVHLAEMRLPSLAFAMARRSRVEHRVRSILDTSIERTPVGRIQSTAFSFGMVLLMLAITTLAPEFSQVPRVSASETASTNAVPQPVSAEQPENVEVDVPKSPVAEANDEQPPQKSAERDAGGWTTEIRLPNKVVDRPPSDSNASDTPTRESMKSNRVTPEVRAVRRVNRSVGSIHTEKLAPFRQGHSTTPKTIIGMGTGLVIDERGYMVTCRHVIDKVDKISVSFPTQDGQTEALPARIAGIDTEHDLAIIKITPPRKLDVAPWGTSSDLMVGERVIAIGHAFGYSHTTTFGHISALGRDVEANETISYKNLIQTDLAINPGNSGGPLINIEGDVIGLNISIRANSQKISFSMPIDEVRTNLEKLIATLPNAALVPSESKVSNQEPTLERDTFLKDLDEAIEVTGKRQLVADAHSPWQIFHAVNAMRRDFRLKWKSRSETINAIEWISTTEPQFDNQPLLLLTPHGAKFHPYTKKYYFEGHPGQFVGLLTSSSLPLTHQFHVQGKVVTMNDLVEQLKQQVNEREEVTWVLWALQHYLEPDATWTNEQGEAWSIEKLVDRETRAAVVGAPDGGTRRLFVLSLALKKQLQRGGQLRGVWSAVDQKIRQHLEIARNLQNSDGSFSVKSFEGPGHTIDVNQRFNTTGHTMEFLAVGLPDDRLNEPWVRKAVSVLSRELIQHQKTQIDCGPLFDSLDGLIIYRERIRGRKEN